MPSADREHPRSLPGADRPSGPGRRAVVAMTELLDETSDDPARIPVDPAAYDESAAALYVYRQRSDAASQPGVVCEVAMHPPVDGRIRGPEAVHTSPAQAASSRRRGACRRVGHRRRG
jgi:uncharacterized protein (DUF1015 family)